MRRLRLAVVGIGDVGRFVALFAKWDPGFEPRVAVDLNEERLAKAIKTYGFRRGTTEYADALADPDVDAVYLGVPHHLHHPMILQALDMGKPVFVEKPVTIRVDHAREVARAATEKHLPLAVNYQYRYDPAAHALIHAATSGVLGTLRYARCNTPWYRTEDYFSAAPWHSRLAQAGGGTLLTQASHVMDIALKAMGSPARSVWGWTKNERFPDSQVDDTGFATIELENGGILQVTSSMNAYPEGSVTLELYGDRGIATFSLTKGPRFQVRGVKAPRPPQLPWGVHPFHRSMRGFRQWVFEGVPSLNRVEEAIPVLEVVQACYASAKNGSTMVTLGERNE